MVADIAVIGAGPAGSSCAAHLAERGYEVRLVDQDDFPRDKPCGDGLSPRAVTLLRQLGLSTFVDTTTAVHGLRIVFDHRKERTSRFPARELGRCVRRAALDQAIRELALDRGARFIKARAVDVIADGRLSNVAFDDVRRSSRALQARCVVASDGSTSIMRRNADLGTPGHTVRAWAVRGYYAVEKTLDPLFDVYVPLEINGRLLLGYGWVFPLGDHVANIGVGYFRSRGVGHMPRLTDVLDIFLRELSVRSARRFGDIEALGHPAGAPLGLNFRVPYRSDRRLILVGDAAGTTDPFTAEGIAAALEGGEVAASAVDAWLHNQATLASYSKQLRARLPRLGQDLSGIARSLERRSGSARFDPTEVRQLGFLSAAFSIASEMGSSTADDGTPVAQLLREVDPPAGRLLDEIEHNVRDEIRTTFPLATSAIVRELRAQGGPVHAAMVISAMRATGTLSADRATLGAKAAEYLAVFGALTTELSDDAGGEAAKLNNALAILAADFAVSRALLAVAKAGSAAAICLARAARQVCEGGMMRSNDHYDLNAPPQRHLAAVELRVGSVFGFAAGLGAELAGAEIRHIEQLRRFGREIGVAHCIIEQLANWRESDEPARRDLATLLRRGIYDLPVLLAVRRNHSLKKRLASGKAASEVSNISTAVHTTEVDDAIRSLVAARLESARAALGAAHLTEAADLNALIEWIETRSRASHPNLNGFSHAYGVLQEGRS